MGEPNDDSNTFEDVRADGVAEVEAQTPDSAPPEVEIGHSENEEITVHRPENAQEEAESNKAELKEEGSQPEGEGVATNAALEAMLNEIAEELQTLQNTFDEKIQHTAYEDKVIDRMHDELQVYKQDFYMKILRPLVNEVISIRDSILKNSMGKSDEDTVPVKQYKSYAYDLQDALEDCNIEVFRDKEGDTFDPRTMRVVRKVNTSDKALHARLAAIVSDGYRYEGKMLSPEKVEVYFYHPDVSEDGHEQ